MKYLILGFFLSITASVIAQENIPVVPSTIEIADVTLKLTEEARKIIQKDVNALRASDKYFRIKLDRVNLYFPIIERVLQEEGVPTDIKYLSIQESALISDAVSSSNAVGYWQFKDYTAREVGLRVDGKVDERKNIVAATHGAAKYFKRNNFYFKNWIYAVSAYQAGPAGAKKYVEESNYGSDRLTITDKTHWYVLRFIAHVIAFREEIGAPHSQGLRLLEYAKGEGKTLSQIADQFQVDEGQLKDYNKWLSDNKVPDDKTYHVIIPVQGKTPKGLEEEEQILAHVQKTEPTKYPDNLTGDISNGKKTIFIKINGLQAIMATGEDNTRTLAQKTGLSEKKFMKYNDLTPQSRIKAGEVYYKQHKHAKASLRYHITQYGESLWDIAQKYGLKLNKLAQKNRMEINETPEPGRVLWLAKNRPAKTPVEYQAVKKPEQKTDPVATPIEKTRTEPQKTTSVVPQTTPPPTVKDTPKEVIPEQSRNSTSPVTKSVETPVNDTAPKGNLIIHVVQSGENLWNISRMYETTVQQIEQWNHLSPGDALKIGQELHLYSQRAQNQPFKEPTSSSPNPQDTKNDAEEPSPEHPDFHTVLAGEGLWSISRKYGLTVEQLKEWNGLPDSYIRQGENLLLHAPEEQPAKPVQQTAKPTEYEMYTVQGGDTLSKISRERDMTISEIMELNGLETTSLSVGDRLKVKKK